MRLGETEEEEEEEEGSKGHLLVTRDSQMESEKQSCLQNLEQQPKAHKSRTLQKTSKVQMKIEAIYLIIS